MEEGEAVSDDVRWTLFVRRGCARIEPWLRSVFRLALVASLGIAAYVAYTWRFDRTWLCDMRQAFFTTMVRDAAFFEAPPGSLVNVGYRSDPPQVRDQWSRRLKDELDYLKPLGPDFDSLPTLDKAKQLVRLFSSGGGTERFPESTLLVDKLREMPAGRGLCSDHVEAFIALASVYGVRAREIITHGNHHVTCAFYCPEQQRWLWIDPQFSLMAKQAQGQYLSPLGLRDAYQRGQRVEFEFFGHENQVFAHSDPHNHPCYDAKSDFEDMSLTFGSNVFEYDAYRQGMRYVPLPIRQLVLLGLGIMPTYRLIYDEHSVYAHRLLMLRYSWAAVAVVLTAGLCAYPLLSLIRRIPGWLGRFHIGAVTPTRGPRPSFGD
jgi:hypothetical protein